MESVASLTVFLLVIASVTAIFWAITRRSCRVGEDSRAVKKFKSSAKKIKAFEDASTKKMQYDLEESTRKARKDMESVSTLAQESSRRFKCNH